jgi:anti-sigma regulatory factor (Ser/Thr protein kinase)
VTVRSERQRSAILGSATIPGRPQEVSGARAFVARTLYAAGKAADVDSDAATLLTSELVTNAILHTASGAPGGTVTIVVVDVADGVLIEVIDDGSAATPVVKSDLLTTDGHGLYLVQQLTAQWGYLRDPAGTTVWFHLPSDWAPHGS